MSGVRVRARGSGEYVSSHPILQQGTLNIFFFGSFVRDLVKTHTQLPSHLPLSLRWLLATGDVYTHQYLPMFGQIWIQLVWIDLIWCPTPDQQG